MNDMTKDAIRATLDALAEAAGQVLTDIDDLVASSQGVAGLHLNGDVADWRDILEGGVFEEWLMSVEALRATLIALKPAMIEVAA
jgi:hypothetical protein